jgi:hypothetical protein
MSTGKHASSGCKVRRKLFRQAIRESAINEGTVKDPFFKLIGSVKAGKEQAVNHDKLIYG